jgi:hypothetical protein
MFDMVRAKKLKEKLEEEFENLPEINFFGEDNHKEQYPLVYDYLKTGIKPKEVDMNDDFNLLYDIINDFDSVCEDYEVYR